MNIVSSTFARSLFVVGVSAAIAAIPLFILVWMLNASDNHDPKVQQASAIKPVGQLKSWKTIVIEAGSGKKRTPQFLLQGGQQRIKFTVQGAFNPSLTIYVVPEGKTTDDVKPEVLDATSNGETTLFKSAGSYYVETEATGSSWSFEVAELQL